MGSRVVWAIYETMMSMFLDDDTFSRAKMAYEKNYYKELFRSLHELKGTSGSASLTELNAAVVPLVELLRGGNDVPRQLLATMFERVEKSYFKAIEGISLAFALHD